MVVLFGVMDLAMVVSAVSLVLLKLFDRLLLIVVVVLVVVVGIIKEWLL